MKLCKVPFCKNKRNAHGLCVTHQRRLRIYGDVNCGRPAPLPDRFCTMDGCNKPLFCRGLCQMHNWRVKNYGDALREPYEMKGCLVSGCLKKRKAHGLCALHLNRKKRGLPPHYSRQKLAKKRYRILTRPNHPLADNRGRILEHRMVLFNSMGGGRWPCFWCGTPLEWGVNLFVDHRNHDKQDNRLENLLPSCNSCNAGRTINNPRVRTSVYS